LWCTGSWSYCFLLLLPMWSSFSLLGCWVRLAGYVCWSCPSPTL
jgi:hypothetical protein